MSLCSWVCPWRVAFQEFATAAAPGANHGHHLAHHKWFVPQQEPHDQLNRAELFKRRRSGLRWNILESLESLFSLDQANVGSWIEKQVLKPKLCALWIARSLSESSAQKTHSVSPTEPHLHTSFAHHNFQLRPGIHSAPIRPGLHEGNKTYITRILWL